MASYNEVMDANARSMPKRGAKAPEMMRMEYERSANGGHVFTHHMEQVGGPYHEPEKHTFGKEEGREALGHFAKHAGLSEHMESAKEEAGESKAEEAAEDGE